MCSTWKIIFRGIWIRYKKQKIYVWSLCLGAFTLKYRDPWHPSTRYHNMVTIWTILYGSKIEILVQKYRSISISTLILTSTGRHIIASLSVGTVICANFKKFIFTTRWRCNFSMIDPLAHFWLNGGSVGFHLHAEL